MSTWFEAQVGIGSQTATFKKYPEIQAIQIVIVPEHSSQGEVHAVQTELIIVWCEGHEELMQAAPDIT